MRKTLSLALFAFLAIPALVLSLCFGATAIPGPPTPLPSVLEVVSPASPLPVAVASPAPAFSFPDPLTIALTAAGWGAWVLAHWMQLGELLGILVAAYFAVRAHQWDKLLALAGPITLNLAGLSGYDNPTKRKVAVERLYRDANPLMRKLFTLERFEQAVETAYLTITKPKLTVK